MWTKRKENCSTQVSLCGGRLGRAVFLAAVCSTLSMGVAERALAQDCLANCPPPGGNHNFGVNFQKGCPTTASPGEQVTCTLSIENNDECHRVDILSLTDQVPSGVTGFPDGPVLAVAGCATSLAPNDGVQGSGNDFTTCDVTFTIPFDFDLCDGVWIDQAEVNFQDFCIPVLTDANQASGIIAVVCECGDNQVNRPEETCDGTDPGTDGCTAVGSGQPDECRAPGATDQCTCCGDGNIDAGSNETCDGAAEATGVNCNAAGCRSDCTCCGDGIIQDVHNEQCDPPNVGLCDANCQLCDPDISIIKTAGAAPDGTVLQINPGDMVVFSYFVCNTGTCPLTNVVVTDDNGTPGNMADDFTVPVGNLAPGQCVTVTSDPITMPSPPTCTSTRLNIACVNGTAPDGSVVEDCDDAELCTPPRGGEGCTPGYWKLVDGDAGGASHECNWTDPYDPDDLFCGVFDCSGNCDEFLGFSLIDVLEQPKGIRPPQLRNLGFHTVAALLNAASPDVSFGLSVADVINGFNDACADFTASGDKADLAAAHSLFSSFNECGADTCADDDPHCCPLGNCTCSNTQDKCSAGSDCAVGPCPASSCVDGIITQSLELFGGDQIACAAPGLGTTQNAWARCYDLAAEGIGNTTINSVTFGVFQFEGNALSITVDVNLYLDDNGCPPPGPGSAGPGDPSLTLIGSESVIINALSVGTLITVPFPGVGVLAGSSLIVEIENDADGTLPLEFFFRTEANGAGECGPSYLRAAPCGIPGWIALGAIGFPDLHLLQVVNGTTDCDPLHTCGGRNQGGSNCCTEDTTRSACDDGECSAQVCAVGSGFESCCGSTGVWTDLCADRASDICCDFLCAPPLVTSSGAPKSSGSDIGGLDFVPEVADPRFSLGVADLADDADTASSSAPSVGGCGMVGMVSLFVFIVGLIGLRSTRTRQQ